MKLKQILYTFLPLVFVFSLVGAFIVVSPASAAKTCGGADTAIISCSEGEGEGALWGLINLAITILTAGVGVLALAGIVYGAVLYTSAGGNPEQVKKAKGIFTNVAIGVIAFAGMYALLNFIIPGGVFN